MILNQNLSLRKMFSVISLYGICHLLLGIICCIMKSCSKPYIPDNIYVKMLHITPYLVLTIHMIYKVITLKHEHCDFHHVCYGGIEKMHYHSIAYDTYNGCLDSSSIGDVIVDYYEVNGDDDDINCETTEYGCCHIENKCQTSYEFNMNFTEYQKYYILKDDGIHGVINTMVKKNNPNGDNCLTYLDYINFYEYREINHVISLYFLVFDCYVLFYTILMGYNCCKNKHEFERVEQAPFDHTREKGSV